MPRPDEKMDKDRFRRDMGDVVENYQEVARRLGILVEARPPVGRGPVLAVSNTDTDGVKADKKPEKTTDG
jgi:phosphoribosylaminoimidazole-succinocarboxamide synthase